MILTADNLAKRGWPHNVNCSFCHSTPETAAHLHISCPYAQACWAQVLIKTNLPTTLMPPLNATSISSCWSAISASAPATITKRWCSVALLTWWNLWKARNDRIFNNMAVSATALADTILLELTQWRAAGLLITVWPAGA